MMKVGQAEVFREDVSSIDGQELHEQVIVPRLTANPAIGLSRRWLCEVAL